MAPLKHSRVLITLCAFAGAELFVQADPPLAAIQGLPQVASLQPATAQETRVKAAYLVKFTQYVNWPATAFDSDTAPIVIGVIGPSPLTSDLEQEARRITSPRRIEIHTLSTAEEAAHCHAVYFGRSDARQEEAWLLALQEKPILTIGETDRTIKHGAIICLVTAGKNVLFEVSRPAMERASLKISTDMLRYAKKVHNSPEEPN